MTNSFPAADEPCKHIVAAVEFEPRRARLQLPLCALPTLFLGLLGIILRAKTEDDELRAATAGELAFPSASAVISRDDNQQRTIVHPKSRHRLRFRVVERKPDCQRIEEAIKTLRARCDDDKVTPQADVDVRVMRVKLPADRGAHSNQLLQ